MQSIWKETAQNCTCTFPSLNKNIKTDVLIIGGGMVGILCAHYLSKMHIPCVVVEAKTIASGTTQNTTAKITAQHGYVYADFIKKFGMEKTEQYYEANTKAIHEFCNLAQKIPCDFEEKTAYIYSKNSRSKLEEEAKAYQKLNIPAHFEDKPPLPFTTIGALGMKKQAQFHPLKLLYTLAKDLKIYEHTFVKEIDGSNAITEKGTIVAEHIILATHYPLVNVPGLYFMKLIQSRSYVLALHKGPNLDGMYIDTQSNGFSFRNYQDYLLLGGGGHKTGKKGEYAKVFELSQKAYPNTKVSYSWATQDCMSLDSIPYIGKHSIASRNLYVATGFNKWGMTGSMVAAMLLSDRIAKGKNDYPNLFSPQRSVLHLQLLANLGDSVVGLLRPGKRCTHLGCTLTWNAHEQSWDCPCHGSRFDCKGNILNNPAKKGMKRE